MFSSIRRALDLPLGYTSAHLRRQVVMWLVVHAGELLPDIAPSLLGTYGAGEGGTQPQSYISYLRNLLDSKFWGDSIVLQAIANMFRLRITVLDGINGTQYMVGHRGRDLTTTPCVLLLNRQHYSALGELS